MKIRLVRQILGRLLALPRNPRLFSYVVNRAALVLAQRQRKLTQPWPSSLMLEVTNHCQLRCMICAREYRYGAAMDTGFMDVEKAKVLVDACFPYLDKIALTGLGEPLLYPHLKELLAYIKKRNRGIITFISTNAQLPHAVEKLDELAPLLDTVQISIDGIGPVFDEIRVNSDFSVFEENVARIMAGSLPKHAAIKLNMVVFERNFDQMKDVVEFAHRHGIAELICNSLNQVALPEGVADYGLYHTDEFAEALASAAKRARELGVYFEAPNIVRRNTFSTCPYPWGNYAISWDGYLVACCAKPFPKELNFGNVFADGLMACVNHPRIVAFREMALKNNTPEYCCRCHHVEE